LERRKDELHPHAYVDRARLYLLQNKFIETLGDLNKAIKAQNLTQNDRLRALIFRIMTYANLNMEKEAMSEVEEFKD